MGQDEISDEFIKQHYAGLHLLLQRRIKDPSIAAEMLNEAVATAISHMRLGRVSQRDRLPGYVYRVALNLYRNYRREFDNRPDLRGKPEDVDQLTAATAGPQDVVAAELARLVRKLIEELPTARDREIVKRYYLDEEDKADICTSLGLLPLHFDKVIFRARQRMRALLASKGLGKGDLLPVVLLFSAIARYWPWGTVGFGAFA